MSNVYGNDIAPTRQFREKFGFKAERQHVKISHTPSTIDQNQDLEVRFPNLGSHDVIVPNTSKITFDLSLTSSLNTRYIVSNIGRALVTGLKVLFEGNEVQNIQDFDIWTLYQDLWLTAKERSDLIEQGVDQEATTNKIRISAHNAEAGASGTEKAIAKTYGNRFCIPLDAFELTKYLPFYQQGLGDRLSFVLHFAPYGNVIKDAGSGSGVTAKAADGEYQISNICLEFDKVVHDGLASLMAGQYSGLSLPYTRVLRHRVIPLKKEDTAWNLQVNVPSVSLQGIALLFVDPSKRKAYAMENETFYNPSIKKVSITIEGEPNRLYTHGLEAQHCYDNAKAYFGKPDSDVSLGDFLTTEYCLWIDCRSSKDTVLHGSGTRLINTSDGITLAIERNADGTGALKCYVYILQDAQLNFQSGRFKSIGY